jgi:hypothetical protein
MEFELVSITQPPPKIRRSRNRINPNHGNAFEQTEGFPAAWSAVGRLTETFEPATNQSTKNERERNML